VAHVDGLSFEFLRGLAQELAKKNEVEGDRYKLLLLLSDLELKRPHAPTGGA
jgi:hypothetical protein